ncbi:MAG: Gfo/Idh/MocA family oxidoreductase [Armatimonadetes bacterium]|nr:Gfo/Idh/MocA family oxidoreductase [Armatimonadota bacterium]
MRIIQVGVGGFGKSWRPALTTTPGVEVAALVDIDPDNLKEAAGFFGVPEKCCFASDSLPWERFEADAVVHSTPQNFRYAHIMRALGAGKDVLMVKPMSDRFETAVEMAGEAARLGRKLVVAQQMRWHPLILQLREWAQSGALGEIGYVHLDFFYSKEGYQGSYPQDYPLLVQGSIHHFDFLRWVLGSDARRVWAENFNPTWITGHGVRAAYAVFEMANGVRACYRSVPSQSDHHSWLCDWRIEGSKGLVESRDCRLYLNGEEALSCWEDGDSFNNRRLPQLQKVVMEQFMAYRSGGKEPGISGRNNLNSLAMSFGAIRAGETGQRQELG